jgi:cobalt-zinc-cadmium efflux system membrane fusion protein
MKLHTFSITASLAKPYVAMAWLVLQLAACGPAPQTPADTKAPAADPFSVQLTAEQLRRYDIQLDSLRSARLQPQLVLNGKVVVLTNYQAHISSPVAGVVEQIFVREGAPVHKGQLLFTIRSMDLIQLQQDYMTAASEARFAELEFGRQAELKKERVGAEMEYQLAESRYKAAVGRRKTLEAKLIATGIEAAQLNDPERAVVRGTLQLFAPFNGYIVKMPAAIGTRAEPNVELISIYNLDDLHGDLFVYEKDVNRIAEKQSIQIEFVGKDLPTATGRVEYISRTVEAAERSIILHVTFEPPPGTLILPEMNIRAKLLGKPSPTPQPVLPTAAVFADGDHQYAYYTTDAPTQPTQALHRVEVQTGVTDGARVEVKFLQAMPAGARFVVRNVLLVKGEAEKTQGGE